MVILIKVLYLIHQVDFGVKQFLTKLDTDWQTLQEK